MTLKFSDFFFPVFLKNYKILQFLYVTAKNLWLKCNIKSKLGPKISGFLDIWRIIRLFSYPNATFCIYEQNLTFCYPMISVSDFLISAPPLILIQDLKAIILITSKSALIIVLCCIICHFQFYFCSHFQPSIIKSTSGHFPLNSNSILRHWIALILGIGALFFLTLCLAIFLTWRR